ncbi:MAG: MATE family efflux transporter [Chrysiogenales bacterium]|nr:MAG: MATE family efflux transporter [Chrysiogenales bacterium]
MKSMGRRVRSEGGYRDLLILALPLFVSTGSWAIQHFIYRMFLNWYSAEAVAAAMPAGILNFTLVSLFMGTAGYVSTFVAQYYGSGRDGMIGKVLWQGLYIALIAGAAIMLIVPFSAEIFDLIGHDPSVRESETVYFRVLCLGAAPLVATSAMSGFFSGIGKTWVIMIANIAATAVNLFLDYLLIFGVLGFPEMGIEGAGIASVISACVAFAVSGAMIFRPDYNARYRNLAGWRFDPALFRRLLRYGFPNGVQFFIEVAAFAFFILFVGRLGITELAATNIAFNINTVAFMPMIGLGIAVSVLVGQQLGRRRADLAQYSVWSGFHLALYYMGTVALIYFFLPGIFIAPYAARADAAEFAPIAEMTAVLLKFVAIYCVFDAMNIIFASAIKGAGDTRFVMYAIAILSIFGLVVPTFVVLFILDMGIYAGWTVATIFVGLMGVMFLLRFLGGRWKTMRVIEESHGVIPPMMPEKPTGGMEI